MAVLSGKAFAKLMSEMAREAAKDPTWVVSDEVRRRVEGEWDRLFGKMGDVIAIPCNKTEPHDQPPAPGTSNEEP